MQSKAALNGAAILACGGNRRMRIALSLFLAPAAELAAERGSFVCSGVSSETPTCSFAFVYRLAQFVCE